MARRPRKRPRQCARCGHVQPSTEKQCTQCGTWLVPKRFRMDRKRVKLVHALARQKGLIGHGDDELYRLRLHRVGVESSKDLKRAQFDELVRDLKRLPDVG